MGRATDRDRQVDDLSRSLNQIEAEFRGGLDSLLVLRLVQLMNRASPLRRISASPVGNTLRLGFADGLSVLVSSPDAHGLLRLLLPLHKGATVLLERVERTPDGVRITLCWDRHRASAVVMGFDQAD
ncbi:hypothetical protein G7085_14735 [Tessaracoccus sp. HDW20]|uniref:hypothetical protein n=1 Tax=Tessaracoccus coleopterorum TaxID=2714950 RepID=UPI0018D436BC|nr:hypothetical protein [Tessaracoccus coleopterorum]NHB85449.1 hypothetical protein [Tessaracoccus coleopterorum]